MTLTPQQVAEKKFTSTRFKNGYDETEVDAFLDDVEAELTRLHGEADQLRRELESARGAQQVMPPIAADDPSTAVEPGEVKATQGELEEMLRRTLLLAQRTADEVVAEARAEAQQHLGGAKAEAEALRIDSEQRAAEHERSASMRASVSTAEAEATRRRLEEQIVALHAFESDFRGRLRAYLELQIGDLEATVLTPPGAPAVPMINNDEEPAPPLRLETPAVLPELPPLPSWMNADAGFGTEEPTPEQASPEQESSAQDSPAQLPEGA